MGPKIWSQKIQFGPKNLGPLVQVAFLLSLILGPKFSLETDCIRPINLILVRYIYGFLAVFKNITIVLSNSIECILFLTSTTIVKSSIVTFCLYSISNA